jgi:hypothetical protein
MTGASYCIFVGYCRCDTDSFLLTEQVFVSNSSAASIAQINIQITYSSDSLLLHWGAILDRKE